MQNLSLSDFASDEVGRAYLNVLQLHNAFANAQGDFEAFLSERASSPMQARRLLLLDFNVLYPFISPRSGVTSAVADKHDYMCDEFFRRIRNYRTAIGYIPVYSPFLIMELYDRLDHLNTYFTAMAGAKDDESLKAALMSFIPNLKLAPTDIENSLSEAVTRLNSLRVRERVKEFIELVRDGTIRNVYEFIPKETFIKCISENADEFAVIESQIDNFRRKPADGDPYDHAFHRLIDILTVLVVTKVRPYVNEYTLFYVGQDRLRRIFGSQINDLSRDITSCHVLLRGLSRIPSNLDIYYEVLQGIKSREYILRKMVGTISSYRTSRKLPYEVVEIIYKQEESISEYLYGERKMGTPEDHDRLSASIGDVRSQLKAAASKSAGAVMDAADMLRELADSGINKNIGEISQLHPNERMRELLTRYLG